MFQIELPFPQKWQSLTHWFQPETFGHVWRPTVFGCHTWEEGAIGTKHVKDRYPAIHAIM